MPCRPRIKYKGQQEPHWIVAKPAIPPYQGQPPMNLHASLQESAAWFELLDPDQQARVVRDTTIAVAEPGTIIEHRGGVGSAWIGVLSGLVKVSVSNVDGKTASLTGVPTGGWIGEGTVLKREARKYDVVALRRSTISRLRAETFDWLLDNRITSTRYLMHHFTEPVAQYVAQTE